MLEVDPAQHAPPFDWRRLFGSAAPVEIELGCGKGLFLREAARANADRNYLGVERAGKYYRAAAARLARHGLTNVRLLRADALDVLQRWVAPGSVRTLHVYFPDPWPKKRHHKRRLIAPPLMQLAAQILAVGGELRLATDHGGYRQVIVDVLAAHGALFAERDWPADDPDRLPTNYALKWQRAGRPLWWARYRRRAAGPAKSALA